MNVDDIYNSVAQNMLVNIGRQEWSKAVIEVEYYGDDALKMKGGFHQKNTDFTSFKFRNFDRKIVNDFQQLHEITTENDSNKWNRAVFYLKPTGEFNIDFSWGQELADEIERLNDE